ncbi:peptidoglycan DD-metalloendopeptidase family protein [Patescibacteria group bacterium]
MTQNSEQATLQVNKFARRNRHLKVFSKKHLYKMRFKWIIRLMLIPVDALKRTKVVTNIRQVTLGITSFFADIIPVTPQKRLLFQTVSLSMVILCGASITQSGTFIPDSMAFSSEYIESYAMPGDILISDDNGYIVKMNPQTNESNRIGLTDYALHSVETGETLSVIAQRYGVSVDTIKWENGITNANTLKIGQQLAIPPIDGISIKTGSTDSLEKIAEKYKISEESIIAQNNLVDGAIAADQTLFLPEAEPAQALPSIIASNTYSRAPAVSRAVETSSFSAANSTATPGAGGVLIYPSIGTQTQGYRAGHYAIDIGNRSMPAIWAASSGTVVTSSVGAWNGGYGNYVIIDHGNGMQTLYAHMNTVNVSVGQYVGQGDVIGQMGNTGRVYGVTGIHLHFEVRVNGVKQNPRNYF